MTDLEQQVTHHLRRRAAAASPRYDLEAIEQGTTVVSLADLDDRRRRRPLIRGIVGVAAVVALLVALASVTTTLGRDDPSPVPRLDDVPAHQMTTIRGMVDALNARDTDALIDLFAPTAYFASRGSFYDTSFPYNDVMPVAEEDFDYFRAALAILDTWGLEAELLSCGSRPVPNETTAEGVEAVVDCAVATRWITLSMELTDVWTFEMRGAELLYWGSGSPRSSANVMLIDLDPPDRTLPLGYDGLEAWETWLQANNPDDAARFLNPRDAGGCDDSCRVRWARDPDGAARLNSLHSLARDQWTIDGHPFRPIGLIPYDPALADEIEASIRGYLDIQDVLDGDPGRRPLPIILPATAAIIVTAALLVWRRRRSPTPVTAHKNPQE